MNEESNQIRTLLIEPPAALAETLGYNGNARSVAFYWGAGDEAYYDDGRLSNQVDWDAYLMFVRHPLIVPELQEYNLGSSEEEATHWLLLDRENGQITVAPVKLVRQQLLAQWGTPTHEEMMVVDREAWDHFVAEVRASGPRISQEQVFASLIQHLAQVQNLAAWLEMKWMEQHSHVG